MSHIETLKDVAAFCLVLGLISLGSCGAAFAQADQLTELERLKIEKAQLIATVAGLTADRSAWRTSFSQCIESLGKAEAQESARTANVFSAELIAQIEQAHPGFTLNSKGELVRKKE